MRDPIYRQAKISNGGVDPFQPHGRPHFELDFVCMFGSVFQWHFPVPKKGCYTSVVVDLVRTVSEAGEVTLNSADPLEQPNINLNFFANDLDIIAMREGIRWTYDLLLKGDGFKDIVVDEYPWDMPLDSDEEMKRAVLERSQTAFHPTGTARLSTDIDQGVVDPQLRVHEGRAQGSLLGELWRFLSHFLSLGRKLACLLFSACAQTRSPMEVCYTAF